MTHTIILLFFVGVFAANATPHFVRGITKDQFPTPFGAGSLVNVISGWLMFIIAAVLFHYADLQHYYWASLISLSVGVLVMAVFHATIGAFGKEAKRS